MNAAEVIRKKRDGEVLTASEIRSFIQGYISGEVADYQMSALLMAIFLRGMSTAETLALTLTMRDSGNVLDLSSIGGKKIGKHSTGGVGDKTSLIIAPLAAACGVLVPKITGRALGHSGGTLDKLESIPGFNSSPTGAQALAQLRKVGAVIMGQTADLAPADKRMYALRDVTATVESVPLITASILSKKLAEDIDGLVLDVKTGSGAFMPSRKAAGRLARSIVDICRATKTRVAALITDMEGPLGCAVGNALEVREAIEVLQGRGATDLRNLSILLSAYMLRMSGVTRSLPQAMRLAGRAIQSGSAFTRFRRIVEAQGGNPETIDEPNRLPKANHVEEFRSRETGYLQHADARLLGLASNALGAGRQKVTDSVDPAVGLWMRKKPGDRVEVGEPLCDIHWNERHRLKEAEALIESAFRVGRTRPRPRPLVHAVLEG